MSDNQCFRGYGYVDAFPVLADAVIVEKNVVTLDANGYLIVAPTSNKNPLGGATESIDATGKTDGELECSVAIFGRMTVVADGTIKAGRSVEVSGSTAGQVVEMSDQAVDEGGSATYSIYYNAKFGVSLEAAVDGDDIEIFRGVS